MKIVILYRQNSEQATAIETFIADFKRRDASGHLEAIDADSREGIALATLYDVMSYPAILALRDDGSAMRTWEGAMLPLMDEVVYYTFDQG